MSDPSVVGERRRSGGPGTSERAEGSKVCGGAKDAAWMFAGCGAFDDGELALSPRENRRGKKRGEPKKREMHFDEEKEVVVSKEELGPGADEDKCSDLIGRAFGDIINAVQGTVLAIGAATRGFLFQMKQDEPGDLGDLFGGVLTDLISKAFAGVMSLTFGPLGGVLASGMTRIINEVKDTGRKARGSQIEAFALKTEEKSIDSGNELMKTLKTTRDRTLEMFERLTDLREREQVVNELVEQAAHASANIPETDMVKARLAIAWASRRDLGARGRTNGVPNGRIVVRVDTEEAGEGFGFELAAVELYVAELGEQALPMVMDAVSLFGLYDAGLPVDLVFERPHVSGGWTHTTVRMRAARVPERTPPMFPRERACWTALLSCESIWKEIEARAGLKMEVG